MKIGILSMQRVLNYGSLLQAYALKQLLAQGDNIVEFIDIVPGNKAEIELNENSETLQLVPNLYTGNEWLKKIDKFLLKRIFNKIYYKYIIKKYQEEYLKLNKKSEYYDLVVIGSDEVFNAVQRTPWGLSLQLYGEGIPADKIITYAASCGYTTAEILSDRERYDISMALKNISAFSVRDKNTQLFVNKMIGRDALIHLDPVLIYDYESEMSSLKMKLPAGEYLLVYTYPDRIKEARDIEFIKRYAKKKKLKVYSAGFRQFWVDKHLYLSPIELLKIFQNANVIVTDTFHGAVLSAKFNKVFAVLIRDSNKNKLGDLVDRLKLQDHVIMNIEDIDVCFAKKFDYTDCNKIIQDEKIKTIDYLKTMMEVGKYEEVFK